jgi:hypothetical protein
MAPWVAVVAGRLRNPTVIPTSTALQRHEPRLERHPEQERGDRLSKMEVQMLALV